MSSPIRVYTVCLSVCIFWKHYSEPCHEKTCLCHMRTTKVQIRLCGLRSQISAFIVHCLDSILPTVSISEISSLNLASVAAQACLSLQPRRQVFSWRGSLCCKTIWAATWQNQQHECAPSEDSRSAWASTQSDQSLRCPHEETLGP